MRKKAIIAIILLAFLFPLLGCEEISDLTQGASTSSSQSNLKIEKSVELGSTWHMKQIDFKVEAGQEVAILLKLADGDKVDGFFYLEKGDTVDFRITGKTQIFRSSEADRFSFTASQSQGDTYNLLFRNTADEDETQKSITVSLEVIYPLKGEIYVPVAD
ncbi:MAG: hypothetical protein AMJ70_07835 [Dehalococcoidia bacterium SG8_51_3]|nr:MAG: hypothetical protein AMJ70_07835 [Dehalococcoidia bacterium SG8_51_3]